MTALLAEAVAEATAAAALLADADPIADALGLADTALVADAEAKLAEAEARHGAARRAAEIDDAVLAEMRTRLPKLIERAAGGEMVGAREIWRADQGVRLAEVAAAFTSAVARRLGPACVRENRFELAGRIGHPESLCRVTPGTVAP